MWVHMTNDELKLQIEKLCNVYDECLSEENTNMAWEFDPEGKDGGIGIFKIHVTVLSIMKVQKIVNETRKLLAND